MTSSSCCSKTGSRSPYRACWLDSSHGNSNRRASGTGVALLFCGAGIWPVGMIYSTYQAFADVHDPLRDLATEMRRVLCDWKLGDFASPLQNMAAFYEISALAGFTH